MTSLSYCSGLTTSYGNSPQTKLLMLLRWFLLRKLILAPVVARCLCLYVSTPAPSVESSDNILFPRFYSAMLYRPIVLHVFYLLL